MANIKITVMGPDPIFPAKENVEVGDVLLLKKTHDEKFPFTIKGYLEEEEVGTVADSDHTSLDNKKASEIYEIVNESFQGEVIKLDKVIMKNGQSCKSLIVQIEVNGEKKKGETTMSTSKSKVISCLVTGTKKENPNKYVPAAMLKNTKKPFKGVLKFVGGQIFVLCKSEEQKDDKDIENSPDWQNYSCGAISDNPTDGFATATELMSTLEKYKDPEGNIDYEANFTSIHDGVKWVLQVEVKGETTTQALISSVTKKGILSQEELNKRVDWINKHAINQKCADGWLKMIRDHKGNPRVPSGDFKFLDPKNEIIPILVANMNAGLNIILEGPKGSGKNTVIEDMGRLYNMPVYELQINAQTGNEEILGSKTLVAKDYSTNKEEINDCIKLLFSMLSGNKELKEIVKTKLISSAETEEKVNAVELAEFVLNYDFSPLINALQKGETEVEFQPSALIRAMIEGGIIVFDEINTGHPSILSLINPILDDRKRIQVPGYGLVVAHENFRVFATMNKDYQGTFELNEATASRFSPIVFTEPASIKDIIKKNVPNVTKETLTECDKLYVKIRNETVSGRMQSQSINIRAFIFACLQVEWGIPIKTALIKNVADSCPDLDDRKAIGEMINLMIK